MLSKLLQNKLALLYSDHMIRNVLLEKSIKDIQQGRTNFKRILSSSAFISIINSDKQYNLYTDSIIV